jgi:hypothetical protein
MTTRMPKLSTSSQQRVGVWLVAAVVVGLFLCTVPCSANSLTASDIVTWNLTVTSPDTYPPSTATSVNIIGPGTGDNSQLGLAGADLTSTATDLLFNFSGTDNGYLLFQTPTLFNGANFWCSASAAYPDSCSDQSVAGEAVAVIGPTEVNPLSGDLVIASGGTRVGSDIVYDVDQTWTLNGQTFSVVGTITTNGTITTAVATPEPSALSLLLSGVLALALLEATKRRRQIAEKIEA